jgi:hypothetical protein
MSIKLGVKPADVGLWQDIGPVGYAYSGPVKLLAVFFAVFALPRLRQKWSKKLTLPDLNGRGII